MKQWWIDGKFVGPTYVRYTPYLNNQIRLSDDIADPNANIAAVWRGPHTSLSDFGIPVVVFYNNKYLACTFDSVSTYDCQEQTGQLILIADVLGEIKL